MLKNDAKYLKRLIGPSITLFILLALVLILNLFPQYRLNLTSGEQIPLQEILHTAIWLTIAWLVTRILEIFLWRGLIEKRIETKVPQLLKTILNGMVFLIIIIFIVGYVFHQSITGLLATTGVVGIVLGFGLRSTIESAFNGIALSVDRIFQIGDMVLIRNTFDAPAKVVEITWRYTIFKDSASNHVVVPNTTICSAVITNYTRPTHYCCFSIFLTICVPNVLTKRILRILEAALNSTNFILSDPSPTILIAEIVDACIKYQLQYWIDFNKVTAEEAKNELYRNIIHHFTIAGLGVEVTSSRYRDQAVNFLTPTSLTEKVLQETHLFSELTLEEIHMLASRVLTHSVKTGDVLIRQSEAGDSMYVIAEGLLKVEIEDPDSHERLTVAKLVPGQYFGEMSLLIGDPRSATVTAMTESVVYEINKETMQHLFEAHSNLIQVLSNKIAERHVVNLKKKQAMLDKDVAANTRSYADQFCKMIKKWFWNQDEPG